jgi:hypothetical protein
LQCCDFYEATEMNIIIAAVKEYKRLMFA